MHRSVKLWNFTFSGAVSVLLAGLIVSISSPLASISAQEDRLTGRDRFMPAALPLSDIVYDPDEWRLLTGDR